MANRNEHNEFETAKWDAEEVRRQASSSQRGTSRKRRKDKTTRTLIYLACVVLVSCLLAGVAVIRLFRVPLRLSLRLLGNTLAGFFALYLVNMTSAVTGLFLGLNLWNALTVGILGLPGLLLLLALQWVF